MHHRTYISALALAVASCSPDASRAEQPVENLSGQKLTERLTRDLEAVDDNNPNSVAEAAVEISELESTREFRRRLDEGDRRLRERNRIPWARQICAEMRQSSNPDFYLGFGGGFEIAGRHYDNPCEALRANGLSERE
jgi:hypothetical protein